MKTSNFQFQRLLIQQGEGWTAAGGAAVAELPFPRQSGGNQAPGDGQCGVGVATERDLQNVPVKDQPLQSGFIDLPQKTAGRLPAADRTPATSAASCGSPIASRRTSIGSWCSASAASYLGARAPLSIPCATPFHNEMPAKMRMGKPRIYFEGNALDKRYTPGILSNCSTTPASSPNSPRNAGAWW